MFCPDKNVIFRMWIFRFLKILKFHMFYHMNDCFHDVQHHLIIIIDGLKSRKSNIFVHQIENIDFWVWTQGSIANLVWFGGRGCDHAASVAASVVSYEECFAPPLSHLREVWECLKSKHKKMLCRKWKTFPKLQFFECIF